MTENNNSQQLSSLTVTLLLMFFGALGSSYLPYYFSIKESQLQSLTALGGGLLLGSALAVVIPEGFHLFNAATSHHDHDHDHHNEGMSQGCTGLALVAGFLLMMALDQLQSHHHHHHHTHHDDDDDDDNGSVHSIESLKSLQHTAAATNIITSSSAAIAATKKNSPRQQKGKLPGVPSSSSVQAAQGASNPDRAIAGLLIHCAADGLAMGAAALSGNAAVNFVVGTAMILHKAPMAFGLSTFLINARWPWSKAQRTLLIFAAMAPASTIATFSVLRIVPLFTTPAAVSLAILFSGGTFLYAATMHILPEIMGSAHTSSSNGSTSGGGGGSTSAHTHHHHDMHLNREQMMALAVGSLIPIALSWNHHH